MPLDLRSHVTMHEWKAVDAFVARNYRADFVLRAQDYFAWQFRLDRATGEANVFAAWDGDRVVGTLGYVPLSAFWGSTEESVDAAWLINWMVEPEYRPRGVGVALILAAQRRFPFVFGIEATAQNQAIVTRLRWEFHAALPRFVAVFDRERAAAVRMPDVAPEEVDAAYVAPQRVAAEPRDLFDTAYAPAWRRYPGASFGPVRSAEYLRWRYLATPGHHYHAWVLGDPSRPAVCVARSERARDVEPPLSVVRVVEFFHPGDDEGRRDALALIAALAARWRADGHAYADFLGASAEYGETLRAAGWVRDDPARPVLPIRLQPIERKPFTLNLEYGIPKDAVRPPLGALHVTRGDGDADRPGSTAMVHA